MSFLSDLAINNAPDPVIHSSARLLEFEILRDLLSGYAPSPLGKRRVAELLPSRDHAWIATQQQLTTEQVIDGQRGRPALASGRVRGGPVSDVHRIAGIACPGGAHRGLDVFARDGCHANMLATLSGAPRYFAGF